MRFLPPASMLPTLLIAPAWAADFQVTPTFSLNQTYTDNVALAPTGQERSEWVTTVRPGVQFNYNGANLRFYAGYNAEVLYRWNDQDFQLYNNFTGGTRGSMEIMPQLLFLDTQSYVTQVSTSTFGAQPLSNVNVTDNRSTVRTTVVSPFARYSFGGGEVNAEARYTYSLVDSSEDVGRGVNGGANRFNASLASGSAYKATTWNVAYSWEKIAYDQARDTTLESIRASGKRLITPVLGVVATIGYEDNNYIAQQGTPSGSIWSTGIEWTPTDRTKLNASFGHRFYGRTYGLDFSHRTRLTVWNASYGESVTSTRQQLLVPTQADTASYLDTLFLSRIPDPVARAEAVRQEIARLGLPSTLIVPVNFFTNQFFVEKAFRAAVGLQGIRHTVFANFFNTRRDAESIALPGAAGDFAGSNEVRQTGAGLVWTWRVTPLTTSSVSLGYTRSETPATGREDNTQYLSVRLTQPIGPRTSGSLAYQRQHADSNAGTGYTENQIIANLQVRF
jgi:uncharacterized protein (PEP-CTERM system associated)